MLKQDKKPSFLENVNMMVNDTFNVFSDTCFESGSLVSRPTKVVLL